MKQASKGSRGLCKEINNAAKWKVRGQDCKKNDVENRIQYFGKVKENDNMEKDTEFEKGLLLEPLEEKYSCSGEWWEQK